jgi:hypothetical protein
LNSLVAFTGRRVGACLARSQSLYWRFICRGIGAVSIAGALFAPVLAASFPPDRYVLVGAARCTNAVRYPNRSTGDNVQFVVALAETRGLVGWSKNKGEERYLFLGHTADEPTLVLGFRSAAGESLLESHMPCREVGIQGGWSDRSSRFVSAQVAAFEDYPFAVFFSCSVVGVSADDISSMLSKPGRSVSAQSRCGKLTITKGNGLESIAFVQDAEDLITSHPPEVKVRDFKSKALPEGLNRILYRCDFAPPLTERSAAPWVSTCSIVNESLGGTAVRADFEISILEFSTDERRINKVIDSVLKRIPDGERIQSAEPIEYVWNGGQVVRRIDPAALQSAESLEFGSGRRMPTWRILVLVNLLAVAAVIFLLFVRRRKGSQ